MSLQTSIDEETFLARLKQHQGIIIRVSRLYCDNLEDRRDLVQEIIFHLWKSYGSFRGESNFSTWMYRIALNVSLTYLKNQKRKASVLTDKYFNVIGVHDDQNKNDDQTQAFYRAVHTLNPVEKALIFCYLEGLNFRQIGNQLGISEGNARVRLLRVKEKIKSIIKQQGYEF